MSQFLINLEGCDANSIMKDIEIFLNAKGISFQTLYHIGSDGASVMTGKFYNLFNLQLLYLFIYLYICFF